MRKKKLPIKTRIQLIKRFRKQYQKKYITKKAKMDTLNLVIKTCGYNRNYASQILRVRIYRELKKATRNRTCIYNEEVLPHLIKLWSISDFSCGKLLKPQIRHLIPHYEREYDKIDPSIKAKLKKISPATIDRLLKEEKRKINIKMHWKYEKRKKTGLESLIPVKTHREWIYKEEIPGKIQSDLVSHDGGKLRGDFIQTINMVDYKIGWTVPVASINKAQSNVSPQLEKGLARFPFPVVAIHCDNDTPFINNHFFRFCKKKKIYFSRSRPYKKDDNFLVEKYNDSIIRKSVGYHRYEGEIDWILLNRLYEQVYLYINFFKPQRRCIKKIKIGSKLRKTYDEPQTPYQRTLKNKNVSSNNKQKLINTYKTLNPVKIRKSIVELQNILLKDDKSKKVYLNKIKNNY